MNFHGTWNIGSHAIILIFLLNIPARALDLTWDGGGADNFFETAENWNPDQAPTQFDSVIFDASSSKTCTITQGNRKILNFTVAADFAGAIGVSLNLTGFEITGDYQQHGGAADFFSAQIFLGGDFIRTGGTLSNGDFFYFNSGEYLLDTGPGLVTLRNVIFSPQTSGTLTFQGDLQLLNGISLSNGFGPTQTFFDFTSGTITIGGNGFVSIQNTVILRDGAVLDARAASDYSMIGEVLQQGTGRVLRSAKAIGFTDSAGLGIGALNPGEDIFITLFDDDENVNGSAPDATTVTVSSPITGDSEILTLSETGNFTAEFRNTIGLLTQNAAANSGDNILQFGPGENLAAFYTDSEDSGDTITRSLINPVVVWDGGGSDIFFHTPENWSTDAVPGRYDDVRFDGASSKTCQASQSPVFAQNLTIAADYGGTFIVTQVQDVAVFGDFLQQGGEMVWFNGFLNKFYGNYTRTGGNSIDGNLQFTGSGAQNFVTGPGGMSIIILQTTMTGANPILNVNGDLELAGPAPGIFVQPFPGPGTVNLVSGSIDINADVIGQFGIGAGSTLNIFDGVTLDLNSVTNYQNNGLIVEIGSGKIIHSATELNFTDAAGNPVSNLAVGAEIFIKLRDLDENLDGTQPEITSVLVESLDTGDAETMELTEISNSSAEFRNTAALPTAAGAANPGDNILQYDGNEFLRVTYTDNEDTADVLVRTLTGEALVWDGGGATNSWLEAANWSTDVVPTAGDDVIFDGTSTKDCALNASREVNSLTIAAGYTGTIAIDNFGGFTINADFLQEDGVFDVRDADLNLQGNFIRTSGALQLGGVFYDLNTTRTMSLGPGDIHMNTLQLNSAINSGALLFSGDLPTSFGLEIRQNTRFNLISGSVMFLEQSSTLINAAGCELILADNTVLDARNAGFYNSGGVTRQLGTGRLLRNAGGLAITNAQGGAVANVGAGGMFYVALIDDDENVNIVPATPDTSLATVSAQNSGDQETVLLLEGGGNSTNSNIFRNPTGFPTAFGTAIPGNGMLELSSSDNVRAHYTDNEDPGDALNSTAVPIVAPEISVFDGATPIADGGGPIDFGAAIQGHPPLSRAFTIQNIGQFDLLTTGITVPANYSIVKLPASSIAPATSDTLIVELATQSTGSFDGSIAIVTNDFNENPFDFTITGAILPLPTPQAIRDFLLGITTDAAGLDVNRDTFVDVADIIDLLNP